MGQLDRSREGVGVGEGEGEVVMLSELGLNDRGE